MYVYIYMYIYTYVYISSVCIYLYVCIYKYEYCYTRLKIVAGKDIGIGNEKIPGLCPKESLASEKSPIAIHSKIQFHFNNHFESRLLSSWN